MFPNNFLTLLLKERDVITNFVPAGVKLSKHRPRRRSLYEKPTDRRGRFYPHAVKDAPAPAKEATKAVKAKSPKKAKDSMPVTIEILRGVLGKATRA